MNSTFMFGEDRFGDSEDFSIHYLKLGGTLRRNEVNSTIRATYKYLDIRYPNETYRHCFPSLESAIKEVSEKYPGEDMDKLIDTFAFHELGHIPENYAAALHSLHRHFTLAAIIDIWSPKSAWLDAFREAGISDLFSATSFSSDHGNVKPSSKPFEMVLDQHSVNKSEAVVIGDSVRRDLGGAQNAGLDCILVGGATHPYALGSFENLLELAQTIAPE